MKQKILWIGLFLTFSMNAQKTKKIFSDEVDYVGRKIGYIVRTQKDSLKMEAQKLDSLYNNGKLTKIEWETKKIERAEFRAKRIEELMNKEEGKLLDLTKGLVTGEVVTRLPPTKFRKAMKKLPYLHISFALGFNGLMENKDFSTINNDIRSLQSYFFEWGLFNQFSLTKSHKITARTGLSLMYNNLYTKSGKYFKKEGEQTLLMDSDEIDKNRFKNVYLTLPLFFEYDFGTKSKMNKAYFVSEESVRVGLGAFVGTRLKTKNFFRQGDERILQKNNLNTSDFVYGLNAYIGYRELSLYFKYDLNPLFKNNDIKQNMFSVGIRAGF